MYKLRGRKNESFELFTVKMVEILKEKPFLAYANNYYAFVNLLQKICVNSKCTHKLNLITRAVYSLHMQFYNIPDNLSNVYML